jgi:hypothetical protein
MGHGSTCLFQRAEPHRADHRLRGLLQRQVLIRVRVGLVVVGLIRGVGLALSGFRV